MAWVNESKNTASFSSDAENTGAYVNQDLNSDFYYLLQEISYHLLQENGYKIILNGFCRWSDESLHSGIFTNQPDSSAVFTYEPKN